MKLHETLSCYLQGFAYIPQVVFEDLEGQVQNTNAAKVLMVLYFLAALGFYTPLIIYGSFPSDYFVKAYIIAFVLFVFIPMIAGGLRVAFANNAAGLKKDLICPLRQPARKFANYFTMINYGQETLELFAVGIRCANSSGTPLPFLDPTFATVIGIFACETNISYLFRVVFWICVLWVWVARKLFTALMNKVHYSTYITRLLGPTTSIDCPFYILVCEMMISTFHCQISENGEQALGGLQPEIACWRGEHLGLTIIAFVTMISYFPSGGTMCSSKDFMTYEDSDLRLIPAFVKFSQMVKGVTICSMVLLAPMPILAFTIGIVMMIIMVLVTLRFWPATIVGVNALKLFTYSGSIFLYSFFMAATQTVIYDLYFAAAVIVSGLMLLAIACVVLELWINSRMSHFYSGKMTDLVTKLSKLSDSSLEPSLLSGIAIVRPLQDYTLHLLSKIPAQHIAAFEILPELEDIACNHLDEERQHLLLAAFKLLSDRPKMHPALEAAKLRAKEGDRKSQVALDAFERIRCKLAK